MADLVSYESDGTVARITMDDGKVNALSVPMLSQVNRALDRAEAEGAVVVLGGRAGTFSAGFDLATLRSGGAGGPIMLRGGFLLARRLLAFPRPVVAACGGHAIAMGSFLLLSVDYRIGARGPYKIMANEVAIGLTLPLAAVEICRHRLVPPHFARATTLAEVFTPEGAAEAGFFDRLVEPDEVPGSALGYAAGLASLDMDAHARTKLRVRRPTLEAIDEAIESELPLPADEPEG